jgi:hypothetical protein
MKIFTGGIMKGKIVVGLILVCLFFISCVSNSYQKNNAFSLDGYGLFSELKNEENKIIQDNNTITGDIIQNNNICSIIENTNIIDGTIGTNFGIDFSVPENFDIKNNRVLCKYIHPEMKNPKTGKTTIIDGFYMKLIGVSNNQMSWKFENEWEIVKGKWQFQIIYNDRIQLSQDFFIE